MVSLTSGKAASSRRCMRSSRLDTARSQSNAAAESAIANTSSTGIAQGCSTRHRPGRFHVGNGRGQTPVRDAGVERKGGHEAGWRRGHFPELRLAISWLIELVIPSSTTLHASSRCERVPQPGGGGPRRGAINSATCSPHRSFGAGELPLCSPFRACSKPSSAQRRRTFPTVRSWNQGLQPRNMAIFSMMRGECPSDHRYVRPPRRVAWRAGRRTLREFDRTSVASSQVHSRAA